MKIAYVAPGLIPSREANSVHVMKMCAAFAALGNQVTLIAAQIATTEPVGNLFEYYGVPEGFAIEIIRLNSPHFKKKGRLKYGYKAAKYIARHNASGEPFDCILSRDLQACFFLTRLFHTSVVFEVHLLTKAKLWKDILFRLMISSKHFEKMIVITEVLKGHYISDYHLSGERIYVAPDGADEVPETTLPVSLAAGSEDKFHVGYIGSLFKGRGVELLGDMAESCLYAFFHIIGGNDKDIAYWKELYSNLENVHFYGFVPHSQTVCYGKNMDALIAPYQHILETAGDENTASWMSPLKIFEYMALGKPIVASDMPMLREVLADGENGILCPPDDVGAWCGAIKRLYENAELSEKIAAAALRSFEEKYTWKARAGNLVENVLND